MSPREKEKEKREEKRRDVDKGQQIGRRLLTGYI